MKGLLFFCLVYSVNSYAVCVKSSKANIRSGPGTKYQRSWEVYKYMPFKKIARHGSWLKIQDVDGDRHWIHRELTTSNYKCAVVKVEEANLRTGPGTRYRRPKHMPKAEKYTSFKLLRTRGVWAQVADSYGSKYWLHRKLVWVY